MFWVPRHRAAELRKYTAIDAWEKAGQINIVPGTVINQTLIFDPKEATLIVRAVEEQLGLDLFPFRQSHENYHEPTDCYEGDVRAGIMRHPGHPILTWQAKHALCKETTHGYRKPIKPDPVGAPHKTVDGVQAAVMAYSQARLYQEDMVVAYALD